MFRFRTLATFLTVVAAANLPAPLAAQTAGSRFTDQVKNNRTVMDDDKKDHPVVVTALDIYNDLGIPTRAIPSGSTDGNQGVVRGIPSIAVGRSTGGDQHSLSEYADGTSARDATKAIIYLAVSLAGVVPAALN